MEESKSLLGNHQDENEFSSSESFDGDGHYRKPPKSSYLRVVLVVYFIILHGALILCAAVMFTNFFGSTDRSYGAIYSPMSRAAGSIVKTERSNGTLKHNEFTGYPTDENTQAWEKLIEPLIFNATKEELVLSGAPLEDSVRVAAGGYMASLGAYHELHCLRRMRLWLYREVYYPNATREDELFMQVHLGHCIEALRVSSMCAADLGLYSFFWSDAGATKPTARSNAPRKCADWSAIDDWSRERMIPNTQIRLLKDDSML